MFLGYNWIERCLNDIGLLHKVSLSELKWGSMIEKKMLTVLFLYQVNKLLKIGYDLSYIKQDRWRIRIRITSDQEMAIQHNNICTLWFISSK